MDHLHERKQEQIEELTLSSRWFRDGWKVTNWPVLSISVFCFQYWGQHDHHHHHQHHYQHDHHHHHHHHYHHDHHHHQWWFTTITITLLRAEEKKTWPMTILVDIWCLPMVTNIWPGIKQRPASTIFQHNYCREKFPKSRCCLSFPFHEEFWKLSQHSYLTLEPFKTFNEEERWKNKFP